MAAIASRKLIVQLRHKSAQWCNAGTFSDRIGSLEAEEPTRSPDLIRATEIAWKRRDVEHGG